MAKDQTEHGAGRYEVDLGAAEIDVELLSRVDAAGAERII